MAWRHLLDASSSCPLGDCRAASSASFIFNARRKIWAGTSLPGHQNTMPQQLWSPAPRGALLPTSRMTGCPVQQLGLSQWRSPARRKGRQESDGRARTSRPKCRFQHKPSLPGFLPLGLLPVSRGLGWSTAGCCAQEPRATQGALFISCTMDHRGHEETRREAQPHTEEAAASRLG